LACHAFTDRKSVRNRILAKPGFGQEESKEGMNVSNSHDMVEGTNGTRVMGMPELGRQSDEATAGKKKVI